MKRLSKATGFVLAVVVFLFIGLCLVTANCYPSGLPLTAVWTQQFGTAGSDYAKAIAVDTTGVYVAGRAGGALPGQSYYGGFSDAFVRKYPINGGEPWIHQFGIYDDDDACAIALDATGVYVAGYTGKAVQAGQPAGDVDGFVRKCQCADGIEIWTALVGTDAQDFAEDVAIDATEVYVSGHTWGAFPGQSNAGDLDGFVCKYHCANGIEAAQPQQFGTDGQEYPCVIAIDTTGVYGVYVAGATTETFPGQKSAGGQDGFVCRYDLFGVPEAWQLGTDSEDVVTDIAIYGTGVYVAGTTDGDFPKYKNAGGKDGFVCRYDLDGNLRWIDQFGTNSDDGATAIAVDSTGVYVAGITDGAFPIYNNAGDNDAFVRKYDLKGKPQLTYQFGTAYDDWLYDIALDATGIYVAGMTLGAFPGKNNAGNQDAFIIKFKK